MYKEYFRIILRINYMKNNSHINIYIYIYIYILPYLDIGIYNIRLSEY